jgi:hypothetical protein
MAPSELETVLGPCCFCGKQIEPTNIDPCRVQVTTDTGKWQVWYCHASCFKERIVHLSEIDLSPAHF